ncbi:hypothetical protein DYB25_006632 [Aphanomyces astaci]|uniref:Uncharacterized protein n=1 Tax=Aphanomyces astaci TaxID=112090 RepID=A0A397DEX4_APHAT|nr:hypothetical protein DYB25_006632 [Aphanomyces astaci]RHY61511.1 hypothetical protein DYB30_003375 [Aphanomyces astaci]
MPDHQLQRIVTNVYTSDESTGNEPPREDRNEPDHTPDDTTNLADLPGQQLQRLVSNVYTVVEGDLKSSWSRVLAVQTVTDSRLRQNAYVLAQLGTGIRVAPNPNAIEADELRTWSPCLEFIHSVLAVDDGSSRLETEFPIVGGQAKAKVCVTAVIDAGNCMHYSRFLYVNDETGETIDFMCPMGQLTGIRLDSDYKEIKTPPPSVF